MKFDVLTLTRKLFSLWPIIRKCRYPIRRRFAGDKGYTEYFHYVPVRLA